MQRYHHLAVKNATPQSKASARLPNVLYLLNGLMKALGLESGSLGIVRVNIKMFSDKLNICGFPQNPTVLCTP